MCPQRVKNLLSLSSVKKEIRRRGKNSFRGQTENPIIMIYGIAGVLQNERNTERRHRWHVGMRMKREKKEEEMDNE